MSQTRTILSFCDYTGNWSRPFEEAGYRVIRVDLRHGQDVRLLEYPGKVWGIIAQPPCTHLAGSGARWWAGKGQTALLEALSIADACLRAVAIANPEWWVLENPVGRLSRYYGKPRYTFHPYEYAGWLDDGWEADAYTKRTCLWGRFAIPAKRPCEPVRGGMIWKMPPSPERADLRSVTPMGFARAFFEANKHDATDCACVTKQQPPERAEG